MSIDRFIKILFHNRRILTFIVVGALNTVIGYGVFAFLFIVSGRLQLSLIVATAIGVIINYFTTGRIVFKNHNFKNFYLFILMYCLIMGFNSLLLEFLVSINFEPLFAQMLCLPFTACLSYYFSSRKIFIN